MNNFIDQFPYFPREVKSFILLFTFTLTIGYFTGFNLIYYTTHLSSNGIEKNYLGNKDDVESKIMMFKKSEKEILTIIHTHVLSFALIFGSLGVILLSIPIQKRFRTFLIAESQISSVITFGSIWFLWKGIIIFKYIAMLSGIVVTITYLMIVGIITYYSCRNTKT